MPDLNPVENICRFLRQNCHSNRVFKGYDDILEHGCTTWNRLAAQPWTIMRIGCRHRAQVGQNQ